MGPKEAIQLLVNATYSEEWQGNEQLTKAHHMAIDALERQVPRAPYDCRTSGGQKGHMCPACHRILTLGYPQYCDCCGQAIDWKDVI